MLTKAKHNSSNGFTLVELLISLAIMGVLLAALAVAFNASMINYQENEKIFKTLNAARQALTRMTSEIRTAGADVNGVGFLSVNPGAPTNQCDLYNNAGEHIIYEFRSADNKLYLITDSGEYVLCDNVTNATFTKTPTDDGSDCKNVQIVLTVNDGGYEQKLVAAAIVRKVLER